MVVVKWSENMEGLGDKIDAPLCVGLYNEEGGYLVHWSVIDPDAKIVFFTWSKEENCCIVPKDHYNEELNNW